VFPINHKTILTDALLSDVFAPRRVYLYTYYLHMTDAPGVSTLNIYIICTSYLSDTKTNRGVNEPFTSPTIRNIAPEYSQIKKNMKTNKFQHRHGSSDLLTTGLARSSPISASINLFRPIRNVSRPFADATHVQNIM